jgi:fibronectin-binding autotransporter adhesin
LFGRFQGPSSWSNLAMRHVWAAGFVLLLVVPGTARAAIVLTNSSASMYSAGSNGGDVVLTGSTGFTVPASGGNSVLVVDYCEYAASLAGLDANTTIKWVTSSGTQTLTPAIVQASTSSAYVYAEVFYQTNPLSGAGSLVYSGSGRGLEMSALTLSGVNIAVPPATYGVTANTSTFTTTTLSSTTNFGSFAAIADGARGNGSTTWAYGASPSGPANVFLYSKAELSNQQVGGAGYIANLGAGATTITSTMTLVGGSGNQRNVFATAVFTPFVGNIVWAGTAGNGNWDIGTTMNWQTSTGNYSEPNNGVTFDDTAGTAGGTTNVVVAQAVSPGGITFNNNLYNYTFSNNGGTGAIIGPASVTLNGTGSVAFNLANSYSGATSVTAGTLQIGNTSGSATGSGPVTIGAKGTLMGSGFINSGTNAVTVNGVITPDAAAGVYNTLTTSGLQLNGGSTLNLSFSSLSTHDLINVTGNLTLGSGTININAANLSGNWSNGKYPFLNYNSLTNGSPTFNIVNTPGSPYQFSVDETIPGVITLDALAISATKTWVGNVNSGGSFLWDVTTSNWKNSSGNSATYNDTTPGDSVVFNDSAQAFTVTLNSVVNPSAVIFSNSAHNYILNGSGNIANAANGVTISGGGTVTVNNSNSYAATTLVNNGSTLIVNGGLAASNVVVVGSFIGGSGFLAATPASLSLYGTSGLTAGSDLQVLGPTNIVSGNFTIPAGATLSGSGGINISSAARLTVNGIVDTNQTMAVNASTLGGGGAVNGSVNLSSATLLSAGTLALNGSVGNSGTSAISSGVITAAGNWTGSGAISVANGGVLQLGGAASTSPGITLNISGILTGSGAVNSPVNVFSGATVNLIAGNIPSFAASGGTTTLAGPTVTVANISGGIVNVNSGAVSVMNVAGTTAGITVAPSALAGTTSLSVSGGLVTLDNLNTIPTAVFSGGTTALAGPAVTVATISSSNSVVNVNSGSVATLNVTGSNPVGGVTVYPGALAGTTSASISGGLVTLDNLNTIPTAVFSGGTTTLAGPAVTVATISGGSTVVNANGGSVGTTLLSVSGGLATLNCSNTIPIAALSGGTTTLIGPAVTVANVSGTALVKVNSGSVGTLNASGSATTTIAAPVTLGVAGVSGGVVNLSNTAALTSLIVSGGRVNISNNYPLPLMVVSGGTVNLPAGSTTVGTANFALAGATTTVAANQLVVTNQLFFNGGAAATIANGNTFVYSTAGGNLANTSAPSTLTLSGGVLTLSPTLSAGPAINVDTAQVSYTGVGPSPDTGTRWNSPAANATGVALLNSSGGTTTVTYTQAGQTSTFNTNGPPNGTTVNPNGVLSMYSVANPAPETITFGGLTPGVQYNLYGIANSNASGRQQNFTVGGMSALVTTPTNYYSVAITSPSIYTEFTGLTANAAGQIVCTVAGAGGGEANVSGFQLIPFNLPTGAVNLPSTNIAATANSTLDFSGAGPANAVGGLSLAGNLTVQNVATSGSVQFGGDAVATSNATVSLAAGAGSAPTLILSGNSSGVQNITAANSFTLTLPAVSISANTVKVGNATGYNGTVVLNGATALTNANGATVNVNAGALKVGGTVTGAAGASLTVNSGAVLTGGPAGSIQVPVTISGGGVIKPDSSGPSSALIGNSLTINGGGAFQWVYSGSGAQGTLALGSGTLNLPAAGFGQPFFRPQFLTAPTLGSYVMTWSSPPANQPQWLFDGSLVGTGAAAVWSDANGNWDTGANWIYPDYTSATLTYQPGGLQLTGLSVTNIAGTSAPATGASVLIAPPSISSVAVAGPTEPVSPGALLIQGSGAATATLTLQSGGPISPASVAVLARGALTADADALNMPSGTLRISQGSVSLANVSTNVGAATINSGVLSIGGGSLGSLAASGGAIAIGNALVGNAQISGNAQVNINSGSVPVLGINGGTTVALGATLGAATVSAGSAGLNSSMVTSVTVSGGSASSNNSTITTALVNGGTFSPANSTFGAFTQSSGTTTFGSGVSIGTADVSAGVGTVNASNPLTISGSLKLPNNITATYAGFSSFGVSGTNLANPSAASSLLLTGGTLSLAVPAAGSVFNVLTGGVAYAGAGPSSDPGTQWNNPGSPTMTAGTSNLNVSVSGLLTSSGGTTAVSYTSSGITGNYPAGNPSTLLNWYSINGNGATTPQVQTFTFGGLAPGVQYDLYAIGNNNDPGRQQRVAVGSQSQVITTPGNFATVTVTSPSVYAELTQLTPSGSNSQITVTVTGLGGGVPVGAPVPTESNINGFQLVALYPVILNTNVAATAPTTLNIPFAGAQVSVNSLQLAGDEGATLTLSGFASLALGSSGGLAISSTGASGAAAINGLVPVEISSGSVNVDAGGSLAIGTPLQDGNSPTSLIKVGGGNLTLGAASSYSGPTNVAAGLLAAGAAGVLSPYSAVSVGTTLDVTAGTQAVKSLLVGSSGTLNIAIGSPLASLNSVTLGAGSTINISGPITVIPELLMTYGGTVSGTFGSVYENGSEVSANQVYYLGGKIELASFIGSAAWVGTTPSWNTATNWADVNNNNGIPGDGTRGPGFDSASFSGSSAITSITLDINPNLAALSFSTSNYTLNGNSLTLQSSTGTAGTANVTVSSGTQVIASAVEIAGGSLAILVSHSGILSIPGNISDDNGLESLTLGGDGTGQLVLSGTNTYGGGTNVNSGVLNVVSPTALLAGSNLTVGNGAAALFSPAAGIVAAATASAVAVPEPSALLLLAIGSLTAGCGVWRRRSKNNLQRGQSK